MRPHPIDLATRRPRFERARTFGRVSVYDGTFGEVCAVWQMRWRVDGRALGIALSCPREYPREMIATLLLAHRRDLRAFIDERQST